MIQMDPLLVAECQVEIKKDRGGGMQYLIYNNHRKIVAVYSTTTACATNPQRYTTSHTHNGTNSG